MARPSTARMRPPRHQPLAVGKMFREEMSFFQRHAVQTGTAGKRACRHGGLAGQIASQAGGMRFAKPLSSAVQGSDPGWQWAAQPISSTQTLRDPAV